MFSFLLKRALRLPKKACRGAAFAIVPLIMAGLLFASCGNPVDGTDPIDAATPSITSQPSGGTFDVGITDNFPLTVTANVTDGGTLGYQWYSNATNSSTGGIAIGTSSSNPQLTLAKANYAENKSYYFYVVVTNTNNSVDGNKTASKASDVATVIVDGVGGAYVNAQQPRITAQPAASTPWNVGTTDSVNLTVAANVSDGGTLGYQWYSNSTNSNTGGAAIGKSSSTPQLTLAKANYTENKAYYFYVVVTNTNNGAEGNKTTSVTSAVATVTVSGNSSSPEVVIPVEIAGFWQTEYSTVAGFSYDPDTSSFAWCDSYYIDATEKKVYKYSSSALEEGDYWAGTIVAVTAESDNEPARFIVMVDEVDGMWFDQEVGKYYAVAYKNLAGGFVSMADAYWFDVNAKNSGVDTIAEAISEYTAENGYYDNFGTYNKRAITPADLAGMQGTWEDTWEMDWLVRIKGNTYLDFMDDYEPRDDIYTPSTADALNVMGLIVDCTDTTQDTGVLYILVLGADYIYSIFQYMAVGWQPSEEEPGAIMFGFSDESMITLAAIKEAYPTADDITEGNYMLDFEKQ